MLHLEPRRIRLGFWDQRSQVNVTAAPCKSYSYELLSQQCLESTVKVKFTLSYLTFLFCFGHKLRMHLVQNFAQTVFYTYTIVSLDKHGCKLHFFFKNQKNKLQSQLMTWADFVTFGRKRLAFFHFEHLSLCFYFCYTYKRNIWD